MRLTKAFTVLLLASLIPVILSNQPMISCSLTPWFSSTIPCWFWNLVVACYIVVLGIDLVKTMLERPNKFRLEAYRQFNPHFVGVRFFNDNKVNFLERKAELMGYGNIDNSGLLINWINSIPHEERMLKWANGDERIEPGGHGSVEFASIDVDQGLLRFGNSRISQVLNDADSWKFEIEIRGKLSDKPVSKKCCVAFETRKENISDRHGTRIFWAITLPILEKDAGWAKAYSVDEWEKIRKRDVIIENILERLKKPFAFLRKKENIKRKRKSSPRKKANTK